MYVQYVKRFVAISKLPTDEKKISAHHTRNVRTTLTVVVIVCRSVSELASIGATHAYTQYAFDFAEQLTTLIKCDLCTLRSGEKSSYSECVATAQLRN